MYYSLLSLPIPKLHSYKIQTATMPEFACVREMPVMLGSPLTKSPISLKKLASTEQLSGHVQSLAESSPNDPTSSAISTHPKPYKQL